MKISKYISSIVIIIISLVVTQSCANNDIKNNTSEYIVERLKDSLTIDANWNKPEWEKVTAIKIAKNIGENPKFLPTTVVKMLYDDENIYIIFHVNEKYIKAVGTQINDYVFRDSAVEFFFTPSNNISEGYFNLEINCIGTPYFKHQIRFKENVIDIDTNDIKKIEIAHTLLGAIPEEIHKLTKWTLECKIPISILKKYVKVNSPAHGVIWRANFYKTADATSNPHYITWNKIKSENPNFHLPIFFGTIKFR